MIVDEHLGLSPSIRDRLSEPSTKAAEWPTELPAMGFARPRSILRAVRATPILSTRAQRLLPRNGAPVSD